MRRGTEIDSDTRVDVGRLPGEGRKVSGEEAQSWLLPCSSSAELAA